MGVKAVVNCLCVSVYDVPIAAHSGSYDKFYYCLKFAYDYKKLFKSWLGWKVKKGKGLRTIWRTTTRRHAQGDLLSFYKFFSNYMLISSNNKFRQNYHCAAQAWQPPCHEMQLRLPQAMMHSPWPERPGVQNKVFVARLVRTSENSKLWHYKKLKGKKISSSRKPVTWFVLASGFDVI